MSLQRVQSTSGGTSPSSGSEYHVVLIGDYGVGKTALAVQFVQARFLDEYDPSFQEVFRKQCVVDEDSITMEILDTVGREDYSAKREEDLLRGDVFMFAFAIDSKSSFDQIHQYQQMVSRIKDSDNFPMIIVGTKSDLEGERQVSTLEGKELAKSLQCRYVETSSKMRHNVEEAFYGAIREVVKERRRTGRPNGSRTSDSLPSSSVGTSVASNSGSAFSEKNDRCIIS